MKSTIAIIGTSGKTGAQLARSLCKSDYTLLLMDKNYDRLKKLFSEIKMADKNASVEIIPCAKDACWEADIIIVSETENIKRIAEKIKEVVYGKIVAVISTEITIEDIADYFPYSKTVLIDAETFLTESNNEEAIEAISKLLESIGIHSAISEKIN
jgi:predicted dinucleotide-binding enzyme